MRISVEKWLKMGFKSVFAYLGLLWIPLMSASLNFLAMAKRGISVSLLMGLGSPQHFKVAPREPGGQRPGFEGENAQESHGRLMFTYSLSPFLKRQIIRMLSEPYMEFVSLPFSKLRHLCRFEKGGYCKKIRAVCEAKKCPEIPKEQ